jgi:hypothetical protein
MWKGIKIKHKWNHKTSYNITINKDIGLKGISLLNVNNSAR